MARPKTKKELKELSKQNFAKLNQLIDSYSAEEQNAEFPEGTMNRNIRDVLAHLHHWHLMMLDWYEVGMKGEKPEMPAKGHTWKTTPELNKEIWTKYRNVELNKIREDLSLSFLKLQKIITQHSNEELFEKKRFKWTGSTSLGAYLISATSSHYDWALKLIKKAKK
ncbi:ClbS/DfsB family four-helix bundle protein [Gracilimonas sediminicola]|uniref:ClbS/DfsB family four-helix bundle protein n=1 Tax=Gracilimonas sediminicola TaxID=2952158 RepID=A0A9X2RBU8_9BACT|nr:ClbS/DfsB family four-helix bundle protein [Gracilimonas sediminicola]MCP9290471.1 ClbS/DfsB family four-helix bundle protein [Gracilimonas sediminicola]